MAKHAELLVLFILFISAVGCYCGQPDEGETKLIIGRKLKVGGIDKDIDDLTLFDTPTETINDDDGISLSPLNEVLPAATELKSDNNNGNSLYNDMDRGIYNFLSNADVPDDRLQIRNWLMNEHSGGLLNNEEDLTPTPTPTAGETVISIETTEEDDPNKKYCLIV